MPKSKREAKNKGDLVEAIVAKIHVGPNVTVRRNVRVAAIRDPKRTREVDILLSGTVSGYGIRVAIECKNYKRKIQAPDIDAFVGKLKDVGLPLQSGVYVSTSEFTDGARRRANDAGIKTLMLTGLSADHLSVVINDAVQSVVHLIATLVNVSVTNTVRAPKVAGQHMLFYSKPGTVCGSIPDLAWKAWVEGAVPMVIGEHQLRLIQPAGWLQYDGDALTPPISIHVKLLVTGIVATFAGKAMEHALIEPNGNVVHKFHVNVSFPSGRRPLSISEFESESDLDSFIRSRTAPVGLVLGRIRIPKIRVKDIFWPPSPETWSRVTTPGFKGTDKPEELERQDLSAAWDPIWDDQLLQRMSGALWEAI